MHSDNSYTTISHQTLSMISSLKNPDLRTGPLLPTPSYQDTKDPCPVFDGKLWHLYGSGGSSIVEKWKILHATAPTLNGPWKEEEPAKIALDGDHVAAPGMIYDESENMFHMFVQTDFMALDGTVEHLISSDGHRFNNLGTILRSQQGTNQACIYDPHPAIINGERYITFSGAPRVARPDLYIAKSKSNSWYGPWEVLGSILTHQEVLHHNQHDHPDYEWGLEGSQLVQLPNGQILLNAVCFLPDGPRGTRQRIFFAIADSVMGPYTSLGPILDPKDNSWESGENGHATALIHEGKLHLFYQARPFSHAAYNPWRYGLAMFQLPQAV